VKATTSGGLCPYGQSAGDGEGRGVEIGRLAGAAASSALDPDGAENLDLGGEGLAGLDIPQQGLVGLHDELVTVGVDRDQGRVLDRGDGIAVNVVLGDGARDGVDVARVGGRVADDVAPLGGRDRGILGGRLGSRSGGSCGGAGPGGGSRAGSGGLRGGSGGSLGLLCGSGSLSLGRPSAPRAGKRSA